MSGPEELVFEVGAGEAGERLDRFLAARVGSRAAVQRRIEQGGVRVAERPARAAHRLRAGERVRFSPEPVRPSRLSPEPIPLRVLHEDDDLVVIDKPANLVVHPAPGHASGTLVNALLFAVRSLSGVGGVARPGIVHRLDKGTSGVLVAAKHDAAHLSLSAQFRAHTIDRRYLAIVAGCPRATAGVIDTLHGRHPSERKQFSTRVRAGRRAVTRWRLIETLAGAALVECRLETGRTHQVRLHMAEIGHPVLADPVYGRPPRDLRARQAARDLGRPALHAARLAFDHPRTGRRVTFEAPLPPDLAAALASLRG